MIYKKLLEFQKLNIKLSKETPNPFFKSKYANLNQVLEKVKKPLNDMGVLIVQEPTKDGLLTRLIDTEDDSEVSGLMPFATESLATAQKLGSQITYSRRYSLVPMLGLEDDDDDGNMASGNVKPKPYQPKQTYNKSDYKPVSGVPLPDNPF